jgi:glycosyltransferase involved in cell wall biosynthesis
MRVLHVLNELRPSGLENMLRTAGGCWRAQGIGGEILSTGDCLGSYTEELQRAGYRVHHVPFARSLRFLGAILGFFREHSFDCIHIHTERANFWYAALAWASGHRRIFRTVHSVFPFQGALRLRRMLQRLTMRHVFGVRTIAVSPSVQRVEIRSYGNRAVVLPNWFDSDRFVPASPAEHDAARSALGIGSKTFVISSVGNCGAVKNHRAILQAIASLREMDLLYLHAGQEIDDRGESALAAELGIAGQVRFLGGSSDVGAVLHASDAFVMPSLYEGFSIAALEAMGAGVPVILSLVDGLRDLAAETVPIRWVEPTAAGIASALEDLARLSREGRRAMGLQLSARAHHEFGIAVCAGRYAAVYRGFPVSSAPVQAAAC